jgi:hypothetical protein
MPTDPLPPKYNSRRNFLRARMTATPVFRARLERTNAVEDRLFVFEQLTMARQKPRFLPTIDIV